MTANGYSDVRTIKRRIAAMEAWLANPVLLAPDADAEYAEIIEIDLDWRKKESATIEALTTLACSKSKDSTFE